jgi:hypothetical protein
VDDGGAPPTSLQGWTAPILISLLERGLHEPEAFDFKEMLPRPNDTTGKERLIRTCAAFANSSGGFLIFGVKDSSSGFTGASRMVGMDASLDFPEHFGNYPAGCSPSVLWNFQNPPVRLDSGKVVHIVQIPQSWNAPHGCGGPTSWRFPKRTNKGDEDMDYSEIQLMFLGYYEKRIKLQLLRAELEQIKVDAASLIMPQERCANEYGLATIDLSVLETVLADTYSITHEALALHAYLGKIRSAARIVNNKTAQFRAQITIPSATRDVQISRHNTFIQPHCDQIITNVDRALPLLDELSAGRSVT